MKDKKILNTSYEETFFNMDDVKKSLIEENNFLIKLVDTIPAKMYFEHGIQERITAEKHSAMDKAAEELKRKSNNHIELSTKGKHKRARLDPLSQKSVSQIHDEINKKKQKRKKKKKGTLVHSASLTRAANIEELQKRLQEKINLLQEQRKAARNDPEAKKKLKTKVKKLKSKQKGNMLKVSKEPNQTDKTSEKKKDAKPSDKPLFNKDGNLIYSKFDFSEDGHDDTKKSEYAGKKTKVLLKHAEKKKEKLEKLKDTDPEKAKLVEEKEKWKKAIQKVEGIKVKDDPNLLKKTLKKVEKKKKKSAKIWKQRVEQTENRQKARQEKRDRNIKKKKQEKFDRKMKLAKKKGRVIPGF